MNPALVENTFSLCMVAIAIVLFVGVVVILGTFIEKLINENERLE
ncbi:hypothetical protein [Bacillus toyonensis]|nr:hypothetical protein [Bacillus toyonensis]